MVRRPPFLLSSLLALIHRLAQIGDDKLQDVGPAVNSLGMKRFLVRTGKYRSGDEDGMDGEWVGADFASAVDEILAE